MASAPYNPLGDPMKETNNNKSEPLPKSLFFLRSDGQR